MRVRAQSPCRDPSIAPVVLGPSQADAVTQTLELLGIDRVHGKAAVQKSIHHRPVRHLDGHRNRAWVAGHGYQPVTECREACAAMRERPLAHNRARLIEQADLVFCRAPVDAGEPAECLVSHDPVLSCHTSQHDTCRNLYWRSRARLPTGHPSWPTCRGTGPKLVLVAPVRKWSLPTGRLARSAYTRTDRALPGYRCAIQVVGAERSLDARSGDALRPRHTEPGHPVEHRTADPGFGLLGRQRPGAQAPTDDNLVAEHGG